MNIDGANTLACTKDTGDIKGTVKIYPLPHQPVVKDLVPDLTNFYAQYASIEPWLHTKSPTPEKEWKRATTTAASSTASTNASCAPAARPACPSYWWNSERFLGRQRCCRRAAGSTTAATKPQASVSTISRTRSGSIAATPYELREGVPEGTEPREGDRRIKKKMVDRQV